MAYIEGCNRMTHFWIWRPDYTGYAVEDGTGYAGTCKDGTCYACKTLCKDIVEVGDAARTAQDRQVRDPVKMTRYASEGLWQDGTTYEILIIYDNGIKTDNVMYYLSWPLGV
jgi:hypothetical protein